MGVGKAAMLNVVHFTERYSTVRRWGTPTTVTASGSGSTGKVLPFGLDCSGFVDWTFYNATDGSYLPGRGGGAASQHGYCTNIAWADVLPGDLVFYADDSHKCIIMVAMADRYSIR